MDKKWQFTFEKMSNKEVGKEFIGSFLSAGIESVLMDKNNPFPDYFPPIYYLKQYKIVCTTVLSLIKHIAVFLSEGDTKKEQELRDILLARGTYENDHRNHLLAIFRYSHNLFHVSADTKAHVLFAPVIYKNGQGIAAEFQQIKLYTPLLDEYGFTEEVDQLGRIFSHYPLEQICFSAHAAKTYWEKNSEKKRRLH